MSILRFCGKYTNTWACMPKYIRTHAQNKLPQLVIQYDEYIIEIDDLTLGPRAINQNCSAFMLKPNLITIPHVSLAILFALYVGNELSSFLSLILL